MAIELKFTGMCEGCQFPDLVVDVEKVRDLKARFVSR